MGIAKFNSAPAEKKPTVFFNHVNQIPSLSCSISFNCIPSHSKKDANLSPWSTRPHMIWPCLPLWASSTTTIPLSPLLHPQHTGLLALPRTYQAYFCLRIFAVLVHPPDTHFSQIFAWFTPLLHSGLCSNAISSKRAFTATPSPPKWKPECPSLYSFALLYFPIGTGIIKSVVIFLQVEGLALYLLKTQHLWRAKGNHNKMRYAHVALNKAS